MTTLWARLKIWKAFENGAITEECAQYFDELLNNNKYSKIIHEFCASNQTIKLNTVAEFSHFNGTNEMCVLGSVGSVDNTFKVMQYILQTSFENGKRNAYIHEGAYKTSNLDDTVYLANIIGQEFVGLDGYINEELIKNKLTISAWKQIKKYLENTYEICAKKDVGRKNYVLSLIEKIQIRIKTLYLKEELYSLETNPPKDVDADVIIHNIATIRTKIANLEHDVIETCEQ